MAAGRLSTGRTIFYRLASQIDDFGILVMRGAVVGNKARQKLDVQEFRGFTLIEGDCALIFDNTRDAETANVFSLAHELGHVVLGKQGVSDDCEHNAIERWCNKFAAHLLLPEDVTRGAAKR